MVRSTLLLLLPELAYGLALLLLLLLALALEGPARTGGRTPSAGPAVLAGGRLLLVVYGLLLLDRPPLVAGGLAADPLARPFQWVVAAGLLCWLLLVGAELRHRPLPVELPLLALAAGLGHLLLPLAADLLLLYLALELTALALYVLVALRRSSLRSTEAGLKYFLLGAFSSALLLLGSALLYGLGGTLSLADLAVLDRAGLALGPYGPPTTLALGLLLAGLLFKLAASPFHLWAPDVYEGAPLAVTALLASLGKVAVAAAALRLLVQALPGAALPLAPWLLGAGLLSVALGTLGALAQSDLKRLAAYSGVVHSGFLVAALAVVVVQPLALGAVVAAAAVSCLLALHLFALLLPLVRRTGPVAGRRLRSLGELASLARSDPWSALSLALCLFSLVGVPPLAGFLGKLPVVVALVAAQRPAAALVLVLLAAAAAVYYLRLVRLLFFDRSDRRLLLRPPPPAAAAAGGLLLLVELLLLAAVP
jgi:NADH-quinone oxidoreductase subunit N